MKFHLLLFVTFIAPFLSNPASAADFPEDKLPSWITKVSDKGARIEWSKDGEKLLYITRDGGDVEELVLKTKEKRTIANNDDEKGYYRAYYLLNGDYLLFIGKNRGKCKMEVRDHDTLKVLATFEPTVSEGLAMSRRHMKIAWTEGQSTIDMADVVYDAAGIPSLQNIERIVAKGGIEPQDFRGPDDKELIWTDYGKGNHNIMGTHLKTKVVTTYASTNWKEEPEGIFPSGSQTLYESDELSGGGVDNGVDIYAMLLDGTGDNRTRLTTFQDFEFNGKKFKASNPTVRNDGQMFAFQEGLAYDAPGLGRGIYLFDLKKFNYKWLSKEEGHAIKPDKK